MGVISQGMKGTATEKTVAGADTVVQVYVFSLDPVPHNSFQRNDA